MSIWEGGDQPCFFKIFKQVMSEIEFEFCTLYQHKKSFKMRSSASNPQDKSGNPAILKSGAGHSRKF